MSTLFLNRAMTPMGTAAIAALASVVGAPVAMGGAAVLVAVLAVVTRVVAPHVAALE